MAGPVAWQANEESLSSFSYENLMILIAFKRKTNEGVKIIVFGSPSCS